MKQSYTTEVFYYRESICKSPLAPFTKIDQI